MWKWMANWSGILAGASCVLFLASLWLVAWIILRLPTDYFLRIAKERRHPNRFIHLFWIVLKNTVGVVLCVLGVSMLVLPGQGLITLILGISLLSVPGKHQFLNRFLKRKRLQQTLNWVRKRAGKPPFLFEPNGTNHNTSDSGTTLKFREEG